MIIGICKLECFIPESQSLKDKRHVVKSLKTRIRNKFNVAISEIGEKDLWQRATLGIVTTSDSTKFVNQVLTQVLQFVDQEYRLEVIDSQIEII